MDYVMCRRTNLKEISDCKVMAGESVASQHRVVVCRMTLVVRKRKSVNVEPRTRWWKLKKEECREAFRKDVSLMLDGQDEAGISWELMAKSVRETAWKVLGTSSGQRKENKETWWWNEEVQKSTV